MCMYVYMYKTLEVLPVLVQRYRLAERTGAKYTNFFLFLATVPTCKKQSVNICICKCKCMCICICIFVHICKCMYTYMDMCL